MHQAAVARISNRNLATLKYLRELARTQVTACDTKTKVRQQQRDTARANAANSADMDVKKQIRRVGCVGFGKCIQHICVD